MPSRHRRGAIAATKTHRVDSAPIDRNDDERLRVIIDATPVAIFVFDARGRIALANQHAQNLFGYTRAELLGQDPVMLVPNRFAAGYVAFRDTYLAAPGAHPMSGRDLFGLRKDGSELPLEIGLNPVQRRGGVFVLAAVVDITERLQAEERMHAAEQMRLVIDGAADAMIVTDGDGRITLVNSQVERMFGYLRQELVDRPFEMLVPERLRGAHAQLRDGETNGRTFWGLHKDGREVPIEIGHSPLITSKGAFVLASIIDTTARQHAAELRAAEVTHAAELHALATEMQTVEDSLDGAETRVRRQAKRMESLWRIVNTSRLRGAELLLAMLREAAAALRPEQAFTGTLGHIDGPEYVVDAVAGNDARDTEAIGRLLHAGMRAPVGETLLSRNLSGPRTHSWLDCQVLVDLPARAREAGLRSQIATRFLANATTYVLALSSLKAPAATPFSLEDDEYIEVLGSFFARHLEQERLESSLREAESRSHQHAERLEALWQIANARYLDGQERILAMLQHASVTMRPNQPFCGLLGRIEGSEIVVIGVAASPGDDGTIVTPVHVGSRTPLENTYITSLHRTRGWDDVSKTPAAEAPKGMELLGWRAIITTQFEAGGSWYSLSFGSPEPTTQAFGAEDFAYLDVLATSFGNELQVSALRGSLRHERERSRQHAERLEAVRTIAENSTLDHHELLLAMLRQAAASIRPGQNYRAVLWRISGTDLIVEAVASSGGDTDDFQPVGSSIPLEQTVIGRVAAEGLGTRSWDDFQTSGELSTLARDQHTRSLIVTTFRAGATDWGLTFASSEAAREPLGPQDDAYIEVLASLFANQLQQRWQFEQIEYQQTHDALTGLLSRSQFRSQSRLAAKTNGHFALILVDIDAFREINQSRGHMIGDAILVEVGNALQKRAVAGELVGRIEGDVFGIYIPEPISAQAVRKRAIAFADVFMTPFSTGDRDGQDVIARTGTIGFAIAPADGTQLDAILSHAGSALLNAKERGPSSIVCYEAGMEGDVLRRATLRNELAAAIEQNQFVLHYQPHIEIATGNVSGCEALIRWQHPVRGLLLPIHFIPFAEQNGIITSIDAWVMQNAFAAAADLAALRPDFRVFFNLSGRQASDGRVIHAFTTAARSGVALRNVGVEITESDAMRDVEATRKVCRALRRLNVKIAIDDFGTGFSCLASLKRLPVDIVKIDQSFISGILHDRHDETIAASIISITEHFGFDALAEGVEQPEQVAWLRARSCRYMQGFAISRPLALGAFTAWLAEHPDR